MIFNLNPPDPANAAAAIPVYEDEYERLDEERIVFIEVFITEPRTRCNKKNCRR